MNISDPGRAPPTLPACAGELARPLTSLFNHCLQSRKWPKAWKISKVVPIHEKNSKSEVKNYRSVSLLPVLSKVLESIMAMRMMEHLERHHLLCTRQCRGASTPALHRLSEGETSESCAQRQSRKYTQIKQVFPREAA
ncbi:uncharacterized protein LOC135092954 [Scylla paramamosain]|uniref:uncharacterized protein LOC135092954 n=1 Tax=Scylla paramamosain TaxID=85552 RepID=UPI003083815A